MEKVHGQRCAIARRGGLDGGNDATTARRGRAPNELHPCRGQETPPQPQAQQDGEDIAAHQPETRESMNTILADPASFIVAVIAVALFLAIMLCDIR